MQPRWFALHQELKKGSADDIFDAFARHSVFNLKLLFFRTSLFLVGNSGHLA